MADSMRRDTVLVVDDTPETLSFLIDMLDHAGYTALIATDGASALALVEQITPDLVLMDAVMPGMDGFEACRQLKRNRLLSHLPVIFMTGLNQTEHVVAGLTAGGVDYVAKPIVIDELLARIRVHLSNARSAYGTRVALDAAGRYLLATDRSGRLNWCTPKARHLLLELVAAPGEPDALNPALAQRLLRMPRESAATRGKLTIEEGGRRLQFAFLGTTGADELLFCLTETTAGGEQQQLQQSLSLTAREAEVLLWISHGKSNRDIGEILNISPRTVNKHLEQVFVKLGVENRASAAAQAVRVLAG